ncbi:MAG: thymidine phosphorylase [Gemmatimonadetes bacterium]|nr:MAG: thymidine phosphorylase [Gemmatimonadota bacterium]
MIPSRVIATKRDGGTLDPGEFRAFLEAYQEGEVTEYQMAAFLMAVVFQGLGETELAVLVDAMLHSGRVLDLAHLPGPRADKHSTGGVGDKVSLPLAPVAAELGMFVPMMSGRGLGHTGGTLDKLESIPGFQTALPLDRFTEVLEAVGCAMIGQTEEIAPLDRRLYALRNVTATVPAIPLIAASIMSKKLAEGIEGLVLDVKVGRGAFLPELERSRELARTMVAIGRRRGLPASALLTAMDRPLGCACGNALEVVESLACLRGEGPPDLRALVIEEAAEMATLTGLHATRDEARRAAEQALDSGRALERFRRMVEAQGGDAAVVDDPDRLPRAPVRRTVEATRAGVVEQVDPLRIGWGVVELGGGRRRLDDTLDPSVGFEILVRPGTRVEPGAPLVVVHAASEDAAEGGVTAAREAVKIGDGPVNPLPLVVERLEA